MSRRTALILGGVAATVVTAAITIGILLASGGKSTSHAAHLTRASAPPDQRTQVAAALRRLAATPQALVADEAEHQIAGHVAQAVPAGSTVSPDAASWMPDGLGGGTMLVTVKSPHQAPATYAAVMVFEHGGWKVLATFPVGAAR